MTFISIKPTTAVKRQPTSPPIDYYATALINLSHQLTADASNKLIVSHPSATPIILPTLTGSPLETMPTMPNQNHSTMPLETRQGWSYTEELFTEISGPSNLAPITYWRYGPKNWGLIKGYESCSKGKNQSPINISSNDAETATASISLSYQPAPIQLISNEFTFQADVPPSNYLYWESTPYEMLEFTFHSPAEHNIDGKLYDMEIQFFHQSTAGKQIILSVLMQKGEENQALRPLWANIPPPPFNMRRVNDYNPILLIPTNRAAFVYSGSLTIPPCFEEVLWIILIEPLQISPSQLQAYRTLFPPNNRPLQELNQRLIHRVEVKIK